ncbi:protein kinase domain-containing protein [Kitasatospora cineracea]|uniref:protein kinase domain-containing protein n=1 Tax=Kitasatospora cineracea TaxID=88074 RepID=UPI003F4D2F27
MRRSSARRSDLRGAVRGPPGRRRRRCGRRARRTSSGRWGAGRGSGGGRQHQLPGVDGARPRPRAARRCWTPRWCRAVAHQPVADRLALALQAVHGAGLIHHDLKPSNVLVTVDGPRVIDFGIVRAVDGLVGDSLHTRTGMLIGSPGFMPPEQVRGLEPTAASDVFRLGAVLVYAATGRLLFGAADSDLNAHLFRVAEEEPEPARRPGGPRPAPLTPPGRPTTDTPPPSRPRTLTRRAAPAGPRSR